MTTLLVGFDSAWTGAKSGAIVGVLQSAKGEFRELGLPRVANFIHAEETVARWQAEHNPRRTLVLIDQPTVVQSGKKQREVESLVSGSVGLRYGGVQPSYAEKESMFGAEAPLWRFLSRFGGAADPLKVNAEGVAVLETYPVLTMISLDWMREDPRVTGRLPKYNPERKKTFTLACWRHVCERLVAELRNFGLPTLSRWLEAMAEFEKPDKSDQDCVDSCVCLVAALHLAESKKCLMVGSLSKGYMVVPFGEKLHQELLDRCACRKKTLLDPGLVTAFQHGYL